MLWDIVVDWDLGSFGDSTLKIPIFLRSNRIFPQNYIYYWILYINAVLRATWLVKLYLMSEATPYAILYFSTTEMFVYLLHVTEISRRFIWSLLRIESFYIKSSAVLGEI